MYVLTDMLLSKQSPMALAGHHRAMKMAIFTLAV